MPTRRVDAPENVVTVESLPHGFTPVRTPFDNLEIQRQKQVGKDAVFVLGPNFLTDQGIIFSPRKGQISAATFFSNLVEGTAKPTVVQGTYAMTTRHGQLRESAISHVGGNIEDSDEIMDFLRGKNKRSPMTLESFFALGRLAHIIALGPHQNNDTATKLRDNLLASIRGSRSRFILNDLGEARKAALFTKASHFEAETGTKTKDPIYVSLEGSNSYYFGTKRKKQHVVKYALHFGSPDNPGISLTDITTDRTYRVTPEGNVYLHVPHQQTEGEQRLVVDLNREFDLPARQYLIDTLAHLVSQIPDEELKLTNLDLLRTAKHGEHYYSYLPIQAVQREPIEFNDALLAERLSIFISRLNTSSPQVDWKFSDHPTGESAISNLQITFQSKDSENSQELKGWARVLTQSRQMLLLLRISRTEWYRILVGSGPENFRAERVFIKKGQDENDMVRSAMRSPNHDARIIYPTAQLYQPDSHLLLNARTLAFHLAQDVRESLVDQIATISTRDHVSSALRMLHPTMQDLGELLLDWQNWKEESGRMEYATSLAYKFAKSTNHEFEGFEETGRYYNITMRSYSEGRRDFVYIQYKLSKNSRNHVEIHVGKNPNRLEPFASIKRNSSGKRIISMLERNGEEYELLRPDLALFEKLEAILEDVPTSEMGKNEYVRKLIIATLANMEGFQGGQNPAIQIAA